MFLVPFLMYKVVPPEITDTPNAPKDAARALEKMGPMTRDEKFMAGTMLLAVTLWVSAWGIINVLDWVGPKLKRRDEKFMAHCGWL